MDEADALCDRLAIIDHGRIIAQGTPRELKSSIPGGYLLRLRFDRAAGGPDGRPARAARRYRSARRRYTRPRTFTPTAADR